MKHFFIQRLLAEELDDCALLSLKGGTRDNNGHAAIGTTPPHDLVTPEPDCGCEPYDLCDPEPCD